MTDLTADTNPFADLTVISLATLKERVDLTPSENGLLIDIVGNLAAMLHLTTPNMQKAISEETALAISLVAGAHRPRCRTYLLKVHKRRKLGRAVTEQQ